MIKLERKWIFVLVLVGFSFQTYSCGILTQGSNLDVIQPSGVISTLNLAPRHYRVREHCQFAVQNVGRNLLESTKYLSEEHRRRVDWIARISNYKMESCESFKDRGEIMGDYDSVYSSHSNRIGVVLPPVAANEPALQTIMDQLKMSLSRNGVTDVDKALVIKRVEKTEEAAYAAAAELIHLDRVTVLIAINSTHLKAMNRMADLTQVPVLMVNPDAKHSKTRQSMRIHPPSSALADKLLGVYRDRGVSHVTVLYPRGADLELMQEMKAKSKSSVYFMESTYDPSSPQGVLSSVKSATVRMSMIRSKTQAVLILDNFKMVRHIVNMIRSATENQNVLMSGNQQWRSPALVTPYESALEGAFFVDHIGSYADLPSGLEVPMPESKFFTTANAASRLDYQIIGHRLGTISAQAIKKNWSRQRVAIELQELKNSWDNYFPAGVSVFNEYRDSSWPAFLFSIKGETIQLVEGRSL
ncbi:MAG: hypothetical protein NT027_20140 [Proteobacteria bacterium]|nr:hypothetical protein [Pseudomonadota bacterium]